ncbi:MAG: metal-dependent hydrolase [Saprospiraceae bacterium]|nr:metal-dependent hydrolase [Saprospiraceae bacterium]
MDSLTQIVLGAAVGEVVLGRKIGNRAMLWGAVAGTIPDLDVMIGSLFMNEINGLAFHRAITHSIFFAVVFSFLIAYYTNWIYKNGYHKSYGYKLVATFFGSLFILLGGAILLFISTTIGGTMSIVISGVLVAVGLVFFGSKLIKGYLNQEQESIDIGYWSWYKLFFWAIFTHPLLDCLTVYGTQLFAPFTNFRVALNNISVADPAYTIPFMICLIVASLMARRYHTESNNSITKDFQLSREVYKRRMIVNAVGIIFSLSYIAWTFNNKFKVNEVMEQTLASKNISYSRYMTGPTILNNLLWSGTAETDSSYFTGLYAFKDRKQEFKLIEIPKNHDWLMAKEDDKVINTLSWFSKGYYSVLRRKDGRLQVNDMRYGTFRDGTVGEDSYIFRFVVEKDGDGYYQLDDAEGGPKRGGEKDMLSQLSTRIQGI